jgi:sulfide:quinone oxidoreductase
MKKDSEILTFFSPRKETYLLLSHHIRIILRGKMKNVLVLGGGFAGVEAAIGLAKSGLFRVTLVSDRDFLYIYPISIWIPTGELPYEKAKVSLKDISSANDFNYIVDKVEKIVSSENKVIGSNGEYSYDYLITAIGSGKTKHPGIENTLSICGAPESSLIIKDEIEKLLVSGNGKIAIGFGGNPKDKSAVRGGPAFEFLFNIHNLLKKKGLRENFELVFFAPMEEPGARMGKKSVEMVNKMFASYGITKFYGKKITRFEENKVVLEDNTEINADLIMFIPASAGHTVLQNSDLPLSEAGFIRIDDTCKIEGLDNAYAVGDIASLGGPEWSAKQGHIAELMAHNTVHNIIMKEKGGADFKGYIEHLNILCVMDTGNGAAFVFRNGKRAFVIPMPVIGHWLKKGWGLYTKLSKKKIIPRIPGM